MEAMKDPLQSLAEDAAIDEKVIDYLSARQLGNHGVLAAFADSYAEVEELLWQPWVTGTTVGGKDFKLAEDQQHLAKAALRFLWQQARKLAEKKTSAPAEPARAASAQPAEEPTPAAKAAPVVPRELPSGVLQQLLQEYEKTTIGGRQREFPMKLLLGAEKIVARCWLEHHVSRMYSPLQLHEILEARHFSSTGELNQLSSQFKNKQTAHRLTVDHDMHPVIIEEESTWSPKGILALIDAMDAIFHCWTLIGIDHEMDIHRYTQWWVQQFRARPNKLEQLKAYWLEASWRVALQMRQGIDFASATRQVMDDNSALQAALTKELTKPKGGGKQEQKQQTTNTKGRSRGSWPATSSSSGRGSYRSEPWSPNRGWQDRWSNSASKGHQNEGSQRAAEKSG